MRPETRRTTVDAALGLLIGWVGWVSAQVRWPEARTERVPGGPIGQPGPGRGDRGGPDRPELVGWAEVPPGVVIALVAVAVGVAVRRRWPRVGFSLVVLGIAGARALGVGAGPVYLALTVTAYAMATTLPLSRWLWLTVALVPMVLAGHWRETALGLFDPMLVAELLGAVSITLLPALFALLHRARRDSERRARSADRRRYADEERLRIAREVHDVVGHSLAVITMQAGVARHLLDKRAEPDPELAGSLDAIRQTSKDALAELRTTLAVFRDPDGSAPHGLRPGLGRLDALVAALVGAGRDVRVVRVPPEQPELPAAVDQAAFRIIQEALTNVVRHAGPTAAAVVTVIREPGRLRLEVVDDGPTTGLPDPGNGIAGLHERARALGGTVELSVVEPSGLRAQADLPLPAGVA